MQRRRQRISVNCDRIAGQIEDILRSSPLSERTRNEWGEDDALIELTIDPDRANLAGVTNMDVANSSTAAITGTTVSVFQEGQKQIPVVARARMADRAHLSDIQDLYVYASHKTVPRFQCRRSLM